MAPATNVRTWLRDQIADALPGYDLITYDTGFVPSGPTVMFYRSRLVYAPEAPRSGYLVNTITLYVATDQQTGPDALDALDVVLDEVWLALHPVHNAVVTEAEYQVLNDTVPCFRLLVEVTSSIRPTPASPEDADAGSQLLSETDPEVTP